MKEMVKKWLEEHDGDDLCPYCKFNDFCNGGISGTPNGPVYPACCEMEDAEDFVDLEMLEAAILDEMEEE